MNNLAIQEYFELALVFIQCVYHYLQQQQQQQQQQPKKKDEDEANPERNIAINSILDSISSRLFAIHFQSTIYQRIPLFVIYTIESNEGSPYDETRLSPTISTNSLTSTASTSSTTSLTSRMTSDEPPPAPTLPRLLLPSSHSTSELDLSDPLPLPSPSVSASVSPMLSPSLTTSPPPSPPQSPPSIPMQFPLPLPLPLPRPEPEPEPAQLQLPAIAPPPPPLLVETESPIPTQLRNEIVPLHNIDQSSSSDTESVVGVKELKELIKGREVLTFGPDGYSQSINDEILPQMTSSTPSSTSFTRLTKLLDTEGNEYLLHSNGFVTPIIKNHDLNTMEINSVMANYNNNTNNGYSYNNRSTVLPTNAAGLSTTIPPSTTTATTNTNSSAMANGATNTFLSLINNNNNNTNNDNRKRRRLNQSPYRNLTTRNSRAPNNDRLKEFQTQILELTQFYGDLDLGTNNRFGAVDSTTIIIGTISRSNSSKSSFRSSLRTSLCKDDSSQSSNSPASFNVHKNR
ncbi:conserved hypothetical protein [Candida dubliniensis CD36]|uniref:Uncharacterized protein n=1 Tax=Candida dubliniensis (strain CD36 / ATCC MYA-646 / CBS 7987 / NCPF 3949 / NRRL Y-17841) TaxID=573826 RepID=B9WJC4_CANDC|nr:conserved hypothetical protein [Candida dubliniensis CD36]CAX41347.1 conserved hypothetical protein [Candida dubliniensis CD36]